MHSRVALDSNMLTYFVDAHSIDFDPQDPHDQITAQKVALVRSFIYSGKSFHLVPSVEVEYLRIRDQLRKEVHEVFSVALLQEVLDVDAGEVEVRKQYYMQFHPKETDCAIAAEAGMAGLSVLLTLDQKVLDRLSSKAHSLALMTASQYWESLRIRKGASPIFLPRSGNSLFRSDWWRW